MVRTLRSRVTGRALELELLITAGLLLLVCLGALIAHAGGVVRWSDVAIGGGFVGLFLTLSLALALRGWGEDQVLLPVAALLAGVGLALVSFFPWRLRWLKHYRYSWLLLGLLLVAIAAIFGVERNGARLWLNFGV